MSKAPAIIEFIRATAVVDDLKARLTLASWATSALQDRGLSAILVGGSAVDVYASGGLGTSTAYPASWVESRDIDTIVLRGLTAASPQECVEALRPLGFEPRHIPNAAHHPLLPYAIDFVGLRSGYPDDYSQTHEFEVHVEEWEDHGLPRVRIVGAEDLLFDYMESGIDTRNQRDWTRALVIAEVMEDALDLGYLFSKAEWRMGGRFVEALERLLGGKALP